MKGWMLSTILKARLRSTVTEERMLSLITNCSVIEGTLSGYFVWKPGALWSLSRLSSTQQSCLYHQRTAALPAKGCKGKSGMFGQLPCFPASSLTFYFQVLTLPTRSFFLPNLKIPSRWLFFFFSPNWDIILRIWPRSDPTMSLFPVLQLVLRSSRKALKKSLTMQINV